MNRKLITFGFLRMMLPPAPSKPLADPVTAATLAARTEDAKRWREYDFPAYRRFTVGSARADVAQSVEQGSSKPSVASSSLAIRSTTEEQLPAFLRRQA